MTVETKHSGLQAEQTSIKGLRVFSIPVMEDSRGWFVENWQAEKFAAVGLDKFTPVQQNVSYNATRGTTRGVHAEPWDKLVSVLHGSVFAAWVDLREGEGFGQVVQMTLTPGLAAFVPRGVGNSFQALQDDTVYSYLVSDHWRAAEEYTAVNVYDPTLGIDWPIPISEAIVSYKDSQGPNLRDVPPLSRLQPVVIGSSGQLATALRKLFPHATVLSSKLFDLGGSNLIETLTALGVNPKSVGAIINAAAFTDVDEAESPAGRERAWAVNVLGIEELVRFCSSYSIPLVHVSSDYVFDGKKIGEYNEIDKPNPINFYGFTKAAGDLLVQALKNYYIVRTSWVIGEGKNFVRTMRLQAQNEKSPSVVSDQKGRLTFSTELARAIAHLLSSEADSGIYNLTGSGEPRSWAEWAKLIFELEGRDSANVQEVTTGQYALGTTLAQRPSNSTLDLQKIIDTGFSPIAAEQSLREYLHELSGLSDT